MARTSKKEESKELLTKVGDSATFNRAFAYLNKDTGKISVALSQEEDKETTIWLSSYDAVYFLNKVLEDSTKNGVEFTVSVESVYHSDRTNKDYPNYNVDLK